ncbi:BH3-interacting domain death agonist [Discoglossus pictus]
MSVDVELVLLSFLECQKCPDQEYVWRLGSLMEKVQSRSLDCDGMLQTDGNISVQKMERTQMDGEMNLVNSMASAGPQGPGVDEELCRSIGAQLAALGDQFDEKIKQEDVDNLVQMLLEDSLTEEGFSKQIKNVLGSMTGNLPPGLEQESATAIIAMSLTRKVASNVPALLDRFFQTTTGYLQRNCMSYFQRLTRQS